MSVVTIKTENNKYEILISEKSISLAGEHAESLVKGNRTFVVTDDNVAKLYLDDVAGSLKEKKFLVESYSIKPGEESKNKEVLFELYNKMYEFNITRSDLVVALGGGVVGDLAGFAAATYLRGVPYLGIPTSLLAQVDSSVGGKTAIDMPFGKNMVGAFYHPSDVIIDPEVLDTLPGRFYNDGMAEVIKYGCIKDRSLFDEIYSGTARRKDILERCIKIKADIVERDERDKGERMMLNFGHTVGHAIEKVGGYKDITHGHAVATGMVIAARLGEKLRITCEGTAEKIAQCLEKYNLPTKTSCGTKEILDSIRSDKKNMAENICFILVEEIGKGLLYNMERDKFEKHLEEVLDNA